MTCVASYINSVISLIGRFSLFSARSANAVSDNRSVATGGLQT
tara:strand:+ start:942 stop:1070 length:129 start_codon:yes stop_codon:yes gene_type:complete